jgi:hypothetical protein
MVDRRFVYASSGGKIGNVGMEMEMEMARDKRSGRGVY